MSAYTLTREKYLTTAEVIHLRRLLDSEPEARNTLILDMLLTYGMRGCELRACKVKDFDQRDGSLYVSGAKGSRPREFPLSTKIKARLKKWVKDKKPDELIFPIAARTLRGIWEWYRPCGKGLHCLRHTSAIHLYRKTRDIHFVSRVLGHVDIKNTMVYQDFCYTEEEFREHFPD